MSSLSGEEVKLVREVWDSVCGSAEGLTQAGVQLFLKLFRLAPHLQNEFRFARNKSLEELERSPRLKIHGSNFMNVMRQSVENVEHLDVMREYLFELGSKHSRMGAKLEHFDVLSKLFMEIFCAGFEEESKQHEKAWLKFFDEFKVPMMAGLKDALDKKAASAAN